MASGFGPVVTGGMPAGAGIASGFSGALNDFTGLLRALALNNIEQKQKQAMLDQENLLRMTIAEQENAARIAGKQDDRAFRAEQQRLNQAFQADQNRLNRAEMRKGRESRDAKGPAEKVPFSSFKAVSDVIESEGIPPSAIPLSVKQAAFKSQDASQLQDYMDGYREFAFWRQQLKSKEFRKSIDKETLKVYDSIANLPDQGTAFKKYVQLQQQAAQEEAVPVPTAQAPQVAPDTQGGSGFINSPLMEGAARGYAAASTLPAIGSRLIGTATQVPSFLLGVQNPLPTLATPGAFGGLGAAFDPLSSTRDLLSASIGAVRGRP